MNPSRLKRFYCAAIAALFGVSLCDALAAGGKVNNPEWFGVTVSEEVPCEECVLRVVDLTIRVRPKTEVNGDLYQCPLGPVLVTGQVVSP